MLGEKRVSARGGWASETTDFFSILLTRERAVMSDVVGSLDALKATDPDVYAAIIAEGERQRDRLLLIASENFASPAVLAAQGSIMTNKYAEGYPGSGSSGVVRCAGSAPM